MSWKDPKVQLIAFNTDFNYNTLSMQLSVWKHCIQFAIKYAISIISAF